MERLKLEGNSGGHLVCSPCSNRAQVEAQDRDKTAFEYIQEQRLTSLSNSLQYMVSLSEKAFTDTQIEPPVLQFVPIVSGTMPWHLPLPFTSL